MLKSSILLYISLGTPNVKQYVTDCKKPCSYTVPQMQTKWQQTLWDFISKTLNHQLKCFDKGNIVQKLLKR